MDSSLPDVRSLAGLAASVAAILTVAVSAVTHFKHKEIEESRAPAGLHRELNAPTGSDAKAYPENFNTDIGDRMGNGGKAYFVARSPSRDFHGSLISEKINFPDPLLQQRVQEVFKRIKRHNAYSDAVVEMARQNDNVVPVRAYGYCERTENTAKCPQKELPKTLRGFQVRFKTNCQT